MTKLLPCPFCGKQPRSEWFSGGESDDCGYWGIGCCGAFAHEDDEETAIKLWNTRTPTRADGEAVAWRWKWSAEDDWEVSEMREAAPVNAVIVEPLYASPPGSAEIESLCDRLSFAEFEWHRATDGMKERDAEIETLRSQLARAHDACLKLCGNHSFATGHGDTVADIVGEIDGQISRRIKQLEKKQAVPAQLNRIASIIETHIRMLDIGCGDEYRIPDAIANARKESSIANANELIENLACWTAVEIIEKFAMSDERGTV